MVGSHFLVTFFWVGGFNLGLRILPNSVIRLHQGDDAPLHHVAMPDSMSSSPLVAALDPRVDEQMVQEQMQTAVVEPEPETDAESSADEPLFEGPPEPPGPDEHPHGLSRARP